MLQGGIDAQHAGEPSDPSGVSGRVVRRKATSAEEMRQRSRTAWRR